MEVRKTIIEELKKKGYVVSDDALARVVNAVVSEEATEDQAETLTEQLLPIVSAMQAEKDRGVESFRKKQAEKQTPPKEEDSSKIEEKSSKEEDPEKKALMETLAKINERLNGMEQEKKNTSLKSQVMDRLKDLPETFRNVAIRGRNFEDQEQAEQFAGEVLRDYNSMQEDLRKQGLLNLGKPGKGDAEAQEKKAIEASKKAAEAYNKKHNLIKD